MCKMPFFACVWRAFQTPLQTPFQTKIEAGLQCPFCSSFHSRIVLFFGSVYTARAEDLRRSKRQSHTRPRVCVLGFNFTLGMIVDTMSWFSLGSSLGWATAYEVMTEYLNGGPT